MRLEDKAILLPTDIAMSPPEKAMNTYRVVFLTGPPDFQYQNEKTCSANEEIFYIENFLKN